MYPNNEITIKVGGCDYAELLPQQLDVQGNGSLFLYFQKQKWGERWGDRPFPHLNAKVVHPSQVSYAKFQKLWNTDRLIGLNVNQGQVHAVITCLQLQGNVPLPFIVKWKKVDDIVKHEFFMINAREVRTIPLDSFRQQFIGVSNSVNGQIKTGSPLPPAMQISDGSIYVQIFRSCKPGDIVTADFPRDKFRRIKFRLYKPADSDSGLGIRFNPVYKISGKTIYEKVFFSRKSFPFSDLTALALNKCENQLKLAFLFAKVNELTNIAALHKDSQQIHQGQQHLRNLIINNLIADRYPSIDFLGSNGKPCEFSLATKYSFYFDPAKPFTYPTQAGILSLHETVKRTRFIFDGADSSCNLGLQEQLIVSFYELDKAFEDQASVSIGSRSDQRKKIFNDFLEKKKQTYPKFEDAYIQYCRSIIGMRLDSLITGSGCYLELFSSSNHLHELNSMYSNNIPEKIMSEFKGGLRSLLKSHSGSDGSNEPEFLKDVVSKYLSGKVNREGCLVLLKNLKDTYLHVQQIFDEIKFRIDTVVEISRSGKSSLADIQERFQKVQTLMDKIAQEFARSKI